MHTNTRTWRASEGRRLPYEATVMAALLAVDLVTRAEQPATTPATRDWDEVHDAALDSFPASDAPSWSPLRIGPPASRPFEPAFARVAG